MAASATEAWRWWIDGLVDAVLLVEERLRRRRPVRLTPVAGGFVVGHRGGRAGRRVLRPSDAGLTPPRLARALAGRAIDVEIRDDALITRRLGPLPQESRAYVEGIVAHQLERMTPWLAADTLTHHRIEPVAADDPRLMVTVDATSRAMHAGIIDGLAAIGPKELRLVRPAHDGLPQVVMPIAAADRGARRGRIATAVQAGLAALVMVTGLAGWGLISASGDLDEQSAEVEERIDAFQRRLGPTAGAAASDRDVIAALSRDTPMAVIALENLSSVLPDDTHLTSLQIGRGRLRMTGITRDIAALTAAVETAPVFVEPVFPAPTVRLRQGDRFTLDLGVAGSGGAKR